MHICFDEPTQTIRLIPVLFEKGKPAARQGRKASGPKVFG